MAREALAQPVGDDLANDQLRRLRVLVILGESQTDLGEYVAARATLTKAVEMSAGPAGYNIVDRIVYRVLLTRAILYSGDADAAEPAAAALVRDEERILGEGHPLAFPARQLWSHALAGEGRYAEAIEVQRKSMKLAESEHMPSADRIASQGQALAVQLALAGQYQEAEPLARAAIAQWTAAGTDPVPRRPLARRVLSLALLGDHRLEEAQTEINLAMAEGRRLPHFTVQPDWPVILGTASDIRRAAHDYAGALSPREESCTILNRSQGATMPPALRCSAMLAWLRAALAPNAARALAAFDAAATAYAAVLPSQHVGRLDLVLLRSELDELGGRPARADVAPTRAAWAAALGLQPPARIVILH
jgi:tetratricopeptide (TPR) repeat protein